MTIIEKISQEVLEKISPSTLDKNKIMDLSEKLVNNVKAASKEYKTPVFVRLEGSVAKDTWLKDERDIDIFLRLPKSIPREALGEISLKIAKKATHGYIQIERFAEHPYIESIIENTRVNIVPCYDLTSNKLTSATDRTPLHTDYINKNLPVNLRDHVRLLKKFLKTIDAYGAEIKVGGFSGYLCELLILHYGSFTSTLKAFAHYIPARIIDIENHYNQKRRTLELIFDDPLIVIDPVDKLRNVASSVKPSKIYSFVAAAREFINFPHIHFFFPPEIKPLNKKELNERFSSNYPPLLFLIFKNIQYVPDVLWGQLYKTERALCKLLETNDFKVFRSTIWCENNSDNIVMIFELEQLFLPLIKKHLGPPLIKENECKNFITKYSYNENVVSGPYIEDGRWLIQVKRKNNNAAKFLKFNLLGNKNIGIAKLLSNNIKNNSLIFINGEIWDFYLKNQSFAKHLSSFIVGKPFWLNSQ